MSAGAPIRILLSLSSVPPSRRRADERGDYALRAPWRTLAGRSGAMSERIAVVLAILGVLCLGMFLGASIIVSTIARNCPEPRAWSVGDTMIACLPRSM